MQYLATISKTTEWSLCFQGKPFNITVIQAYAPTSNTEEAEVEWFYEDLQDLLELTPPKNVLFIIGDWNAKVGSQETTGVTGKFGLGVQNEAGQRLVDFCQENKLIIANTLFKQHEKTLHMDITSWSTLKSDWLYFFAARDGEVLYSQQKQDQKELLIAKFRLKLKKVGKTNRPFRYDLNQTLSDYTVEVRNRFKGLNLMEYLMSYGQRFVTFYRKQGSRPSPRKRNARKQNGCLRRPYKWLWNEEKQKAKEKKKDIPIWMQTSKE